MLQSREMIEGAGAAFVAIRLLFPAPLAKNRHAVHMFLVGKQVWFGRTVLAAYMLLVCFGHALHALPGHQHGNAVCGCHSSSSAFNSDNCSSPCQAETCQADGSCGASSHSSHLTSPCPFGHTDSTVGQTAIVVEKNNSDQSVEFAWQNAGCAELCAICQVLAAPQSAQPCVDVDLNIQPLYFATNGPYSFCVSDVLSNFSARGPPSVIA